MACNESRLVPQAAVAAAAAAAGLTAARLGGSPLAVADAVADAVHHVWRWTSPDARVPGAPVVEVTSGVDELGAWFADTVRQADEGVGSVADVPVARCSDVGLDVDEVSTAASADGYSVQSLADPPQLLDGSGPGACVGAAHELGVSRQPRHGVLGGAAHQLEDCAPCDGDLGGEARGMRDLGDAACGPADLLPCDGVLGGADHRLGDPLLGGARGLGVLQRPREDAATAWELPRPPEAEEEKLVVAAEEFDATDATDRSCEAELAGAAGPTIQFENPSLVPGKEAVDAPVLVDWDDTIARLTTLMNVDMGIGPKSWLPGHSGLHTRTINLFKELGELKKGHDAGRIWPSPRLSAMLEERVALESLCVG